MNEARALAAALSVEQQVVYGYGVAGAHLTGRDRARALTALQVHQTRRDRLATLVTAAGASPPTAAAAYALPFPVTSPTTARALCAHLEDGCCGAAWDLAASSAADDVARHLAVGWLTEAATSAAAWRGKGADAPALPGRP
jgi:hypothetical protein